MISMEFAWFLAATDGAFDDKHSALPDPFGEDRLCRGKGLIEDRCMRRRLPTVVGQGSNPKAITEHHPDAPALCRHGQPRS
jgi:hypothetical protein